MLPKPTDAELEILTLLWSRGPSTVRDIHEVITQQRPTQYTTVLKTLQIMAEKGIVRRDEKARAHIYEPSHPREATQKLLAGDLLQRGFSGSAAKLMQGALSAKRTSKAEIAEIRRLLDDYEGGKR